MHNLFKTDTVWVTEVWKVTCYTPTLKLTHRDMRKIENSKSCIFHFPPACHSHLLCFCWYLDKEQTASMTLSATWRSSRFEHGEWEKEFPSLLSVHLHFLKMCFLVFLKVRISHHNFCKKLKSSPFAETVVQNCQLWNTGAKYFATPFQDRMDREKRNIFFKV